MKTLLTNDDGVNAPGLRAICDALTNAGHEVFVAAPMRQQSGVSHSMTVFEPLRAVPIKDGSISGVGVYGTPVDCVKLALGILCPFKPDLIVSGINLGPNAGPDIFYSGTVGAAAEGANAGIPAVALSHENVAGVEDLPLVAKRAAELIDKIDWSKINKKHVINVNFPACHPSRWAGTKVCKQSESVWNNKFMEKRDPRGEPYWWMNGEMEPAVHRADTDRHFLARDYITVTPLKFIQTDESGLSVLTEMGLEN